MRLTLLHVNDLHGRLDALPRLATLIQRERALARADGRSVLLLDAGDSSSKRNPESLATQGRANFILLEALGCQATTLGNRDVKWGAAALQKMIAAVSFPVLAANLVKRGRPETLAVPGLRPYAIAGVDGYPIGIVGLTAWQGYDYAPFGYRAVNGLGRLRELIEQARAAGAQAVVLLSHMGHPLDRVAARAAGDLAAIVGGHSHVSLDPPLEVNGVPIAHAGAYGAYLGRLDLSLDPDIGRTVEFGGKLIECDDSVPVDGTLAATLELVREEVAGMAKEVKERGK